MLGEPLNFTAIASIPSQIVNHLLGGLNYFFKHVFEWPAKFFNQKGCRKQKKVEKHWANSKALIKK
jgi:hypothetical protein